MKKKSALSIGSQIFLGKVLVGIFWLLAGVAGLFGNVPGHILQIIFLLGVAVLWTRLLRAKKEEGDEMADSNYMRAKATAGDWMHIVFCAATIAVPLMGFIPGSEHWNWPRVMAWSFFMLIGIQDLITGIVFKKLEA